MKTYTLIFKDKSGSELDRKDTTANNIKEARAYAAKVFANSMINDLHKITVRAK